MNKIQRRNHYLNGTHISVNASILKKNCGSSFLNSSKKNQNFSNEEGNESLMSAKANKRNNDLITHNLIQEDSLSKFDAFNFTFQKEKSISESKNKNKKIILSNKGKENNCFTFLNHKRTSNFNSGLTLCETKTDLDFFSNGKFSFSIFQLILMII